VANLTILTSWAAVCPRPPAFSLHGPDATLTSWSIVEPARYASVESGRVRPGGSDLQARQHVAMLPANPMNAQVKGATKRAAKGPYPWRPPE